MYGDILNGNHSIKIVVIVEEIHQKKNHSEEKEYSSSGSFLEYKITDLY